MGTMIHAGGEGGKKGDGAYDEIIAKALAEVGLMVELLADRAAGKEPRFDEFMERFGDLFPEQPQDLDELLEHLELRRGQLVRREGAVLPKDRFDDVARGLERRG